MNPVRSLLLPLLAAATLLVASSACAQAVGDPPGGCGPTVAQPVAGGTDTAPALQPAIATFSDVISPLRLAVALSRLWLSRPSPTSARVPFVAVRTSVGHGAFVARRSVR